MSVISDSIERKNRSNALTLPILSPTKIQNGVREFVFRVIPYKYNAGGDPAIFIYQHNRIGSKKKSFAVCTGKDKCPYCLAGEKLRNEIGGEEYKKYYRDFKPDTQIYLPGIMKGRVPTFYFIKLSNATNYNKEFLNIITNKQLKALFNIPDDVPYINLWDLKSGIDLNVSVNPPDSSSIYPTFTLKESLKMTPAFSNNIEKELIVDSMKNMPDFVKVYTQWAGSQEKLETLFDEQYKKNQTSSNNNSLNTQHSNQSSNQHSNQSPNQSSTSNTSSDNNSSVPQNENYTTDEINVDDINIDEINNSPADNASVNNTVEDDKIDDDFDAIMAEIDKK